MLMTSYFRKKLMDHLTGVAAYSFPATLYVALHNADPTVAGSLLDEVAAAGYARQSLAGKMGAADATTGIAVNTSTISFGPAAADWNLIPFFSITDALSAGNILIIGEPSVPKTIFSGTPFQIPPGALRLRYI